MCACSGGTHVRMQWGDACVHAVGGCMCECSGGMHAEDSMWASGGREDTYVHVVDRGTCVHAVDRGGGGGGDSPSGNQTSVYGSTVHTPDLHSNRRK